MSKEIESVIRKSIVKSLREFGYPSVNEENVLTDLVYRKFAKSQLQEVIEMVPVGRKSDVCRKLIEEIDALEKEGDNGK